MVGPLNEGIWMCFRYLASSLKLKFDILISSPTRYQCCHPGIEFYWCYFEPLILCFKYVPHVHYASVRVACVYYTNARTLTFYSDFYYVLNTCDMYIMYPYVLPGPTRGVKGGVFPGPPLF